ncbi:MAG TPA: flagellar hook basal-body protein [Blastocatellia bacterium]|nr:flagellar hook basal-body protein [Blastocatellia bacterium]
MDSGFYAAVTGLISRTDALDVVADNLANTDTTGYKARHEFYQALAKASEGSVDPLNNAINNYGILGGTTTDLAPGSIERTGNQLDLALEGSGFLTVQTPSGIRYTRNGSLHLGVNGELLTATGDKVLATPPNPTADPVPIILPEGPISVSADGTISSEGTVVAQLNLVTFSKDTQLTPVGSMYFQAPKGTAMPAAEVSVRQGSLEASNYNPVEGTVDLITVQRHAQLLERALWIFDSDFAQAATQDLPRVE